MPRIFVDVNVPIEQASISVAYRQIDIQVSKKHPLLNMMNIQQINPAYICPVGVTLQLDANSVLQVLCQLDTCRALRLHEQVL